MMGRAGPNRKKSVRSVLYCHTLLRNLQGFTSCGSNAAEQNLFDSRSRTPLVIPVLVKRLLLKVLS